MIIDFHAIQLCWRINKIVQRERGAVAYTSVHTVTYVANRAHGLMLVFAASHTH